SMTPWVIDVPPIRLLGWSGRSTRRADGMGDVVIGVVAARFCGMGVYGLVAPTAPPATFVGPPAPWKTSKV
ncbi:hypothetical protein NE236_20890, partial [Actinoallomurus purpureus]|uniref:hypothetical protein n=1 Tax=Actinoallomurus purpureus TaxID=478114 RepID=UPI002093BAE6